MKEIERKFLVNKNALPSLDLFDHIIIIQGYLLNTKEKQFVLDYLTGKHL